jgi:hypothetical protein
VTGTSCAFYVGFNGIIGENNYPNPYAYARRSNQQSTDPSWPDKCKFYITGEGNCKIGNLYIKDGTVVWKEPGSSSSILTISQYGLKATDIELGECKLSSTGTDLYFYSPNKLHILADKKGINANSLGFIIDANSVAEVEYEYAIFGKNDPTSISVNFWGTRFGDGYFSPLLRFRQTKDFFSKDENGAYIPKIATIYLCWSDVFIWGLHNTNLNHKVKVTFTLSHDGNTTSHWRVVGGNITNLDGSSVTTYNKTATWDGITVDSCQSIKV